MKLPVRPLGLAATTVILLASCAEPVKVVVPEPQAPEASTAQGLVRRFEWAVNNRSMAVLEDVFTDDFAFISAGVDSAGNPTRDAIGGRDWMLSRFRCMFEGGGPNEPPAQRVQLILDHNLVPLPDPRPGRVDSLFKSIRTSLDLKVDTGDGSTLEITGYALFFVARGDTAAIPPDLAARGFKKDKARWWISRWEDESIAYSGKPRDATNPTKNVTVGAILGLYDCAP